MGYNSREEISTFALTTVTYGLGPAPYLANRVLRQLALDEGKNFPLAANILNNATYVDDTFGGADTLEEAQQAATQLDALCTAGGFHLQKWTSNNMTLLDDIHPSRRVSNSFHIQDNQPIRTLGISWHPDFDSF